MENNFKITKIRKAIIDLFSMSNKPLSSLDVQKSLFKKKISANKTTVYRELEFLREQKIIEEFNFADRIKRYEIISKHHHHIICTKCDKVECVELSKDLGKQEKIIEKDKKFKIINHSLEFYGICQKCQASLK